MRRRAKIPVLLAVTVVLAQPAGGAPAKEWSPSCRAATALGERPHELAFRIRCNFEMRWVSVDPDDPAVVKAVRRHPRLRHPDPEDRFRCWRKDGSARCAGRAGSHVTLSGAFRMHGQRCQTATHFGVQGGMDCDTPGTACPAIGYFGEIRDPRPSGCG